MDRQKRHVRQQPQKSGAENRRRPRQRHFFDNGSDRPSESDVELVPQPLQLLLPTSGVAAILLQTDGGHPGVLQEPSGHLLRRGGPCYSIVPGGQRFLPI